MKYDITNDLFFWGKYLYFYNLLIFFYNKLFDILFFCKSVYGFSIMTNLSQLHNIMVVLLIITKSMPVCFKSTHGI